MQIIEPWKCEQHSPEKFSKLTQDNREIKEVTTVALENDEVFYACGMSSEALDCMDGDSTE